MMRNVKKIARLCIVIMLMGILTGCGVVEVRIKKIEDIGIEGIRVYKEQLEMVATSDANQGETSSEEIQEEVLPVATPEPEFYEFTTSEKEYFSDALFIGDSRTAGLKMFGSLDNADYFANPGLNLYTLPTKKIEIDEEKLKLEELLEKKDYKKIYVMFGINELGYNYDTTIEKYNNLVAMLQEKEPEAIIFVCANLHVTKLRNDNDKVHNNEAINKINAQIATLEDKKDIFYVDVNVLFDDEEGNLAKEFASDDSHVKAAHYVDWCEWLREHTIVK